MSKPLSERRAADRETMAKAIEKLVVECGATVTRVPMHAHELWLSVVAPGGLRVTIDFDGKSPQPDVHVLSWNMDYDSPNRLCPGTFGGGVNPHHGHKATYVAEGFEDLCTQLKAGLLMARDGTAYQKKAVPA